MPRPAATTAPAKPTFSVKVDLGTVPTVPGRLKKAEVKMLAETSLALAAAIGIASRSRRIAATTHAVIGVGDTALIEIGAGVPFARIRDLGGRIEPRAEGGVLAFANGEFRPYAYQKGLHYVEAGLSRFEEYSLLNFHRNFDRI